jgi:hypothetical protein
VNGQAEEHVWKHCELWDAPHGGGLVMSALTKICRCAVPLVTSTVERQSRQQIYCSPRCMRKANYARKAGSGLLVGQDTPLVPNLPKSPSENNVLQWPKKQGRAFPVTAQSTCLVAVTGNGLELVNSTVRRLQNQMVRSRWGINLVASRKTYGNKLKSSVIFIAILLDDEAGPLQWTSPLRAKSSTWYGPRKRPFFWQTVAECERIASRRDGVKSVGNQSPPPRGSFPSPRCLF